VASSNEQYRTDGTKEQIHMADHRTENKSQRIQKREPITPTAKAKGAKPLQPLEKRT
jgi:hypothetical protein